MQHTVDASEVLQGGGPRRLHMLFDRYVELHNGYWRVQFSRCPLGYGQAPPSPSEQYGGPFALS
jgi:hypothetical protein